MAAAVAASVRVLLGTAAKAGAARAAAAPASASSSAGLCCCCSSSNGGSLKANPFCTAAPQQQQPSAAAPPPDLKNYLWKRYNEAKKVTKDLVPSIMSNLLNPDAIFSNNEMSLSDIEIYGFDYDYTLVFYSKHLHTLIFNAARDLLINEHRYPAEIRKYDYDPRFAIRGLHYDVHRALLMKIDAFHYIQLGTVYRGLSVVPDEEVIAMYDGSHVPLEQMSDFYGKSSQGNTMKQFMDIFSLPEMTLLSCVNEYFLKNNIDYEPVHLYKDVKDSIRDVHIKGIMYRAIEADIEKYICYAEQTRAVLAKLADHGKKMFLITNSPSSFVDRGMRFIVGKDWRDLFDVVIVQADKPNFFNDKRRPFRKVNEKGVLLWDKIHELQKGQIYKQGNLYEFLKLTGWRGSKVLYFGDHIYSDLAIRICSGVKAQDLTLKHGWRTGAIIPELRTEIKIMNTERYIQTMTWLQTLTGLLEHMQVHRDPDSQLILHEWKKERKEMREMTRNFFNSQFGSLFRTDQNPTYFLRRLSRFADIYMASLSCLLNYDHDYTFYPRRTPLQHELPTWSDQLCTGNNLVPQIVVR
ncbi:5'-nucleotidase domain-containing protein 3 isoform X2 [Hemicordylus capensis]|uniref:5'-nucleotidase domain-containing protein 3 isoform X2 n=1 Tax=Hemicordylus capensis TaxID=884348 RepID=UPI00230345A0|nr:5'-nucleotidase domain-containing protein 3 isoform X2 [Hemicordylus capensis]